MNIVSLVWNIPQDLFIWLAPLPMDLTSSEMMDMTTLTKADLLFHAHILQLAIKKKKEKKNFVFGSLFVLATPSTKM